MAKYIKIFDTNSQYESYITGASADLPNASYISDESISRLKSDKVPPIVPMTIETSEIYVGDVARITVNVPDDADGMVELVVKDANASLIFSATTQVFDGKAIFNVDNINVYGTYWAKARYFGDEKYLSDRCTDRIEVSRNQTPMSIEVVTDYSTAQFTIKLPIDIFGSVYATLDGVAEDWSGEGQPGIINLTNGQGGSSTEELADGTHTLVVSFSGNTKYEPVTDSETFTIQDEREEMLLSMGVGNVNVGDNAEVVIYYIEGAGGYMSIQIVNSQTSATVFSDTATLTGPGADRVVFVWNNAGPAGDYDVYVEYSGDSNYKPTSTDDSFEVSKPGGNI